MRLPNHAFPHLFRALPSMMHDLYGWRIQAIPTRPVQPVQQVDLVEEDGKAFIEWLLQIANRSERLAPKEQESAHWLRSQLLLCVVERGQSITAELATGKLRPKTGEVPEDPRRGGPASNRTLRTSVGIDQTACETPDAFMRP